jgi:hypothetical protein
LDRLDHLLSDQCEPISYDLCEYIKTHIMSHPILRSKSYVHRMYVQDQVVIRTTRI